MAKKSILSKDKIIEIKRFISNMKNAGINFQKVILFGSYARDKANDWSDIDLCVISEEFGINRHDDRIRLMKIRDDRTIDIEPHPFNKQEYFNKWDPLASEIRKYGISVY